MHTHPLSKKIALFSGPLLFIIVLNFPFDSLSSEAAAVLATASWMVSWWISEAVSISVTALLPLIIFPLTGVMAVNDVGANYGSSIVFLFFGGFVCYLDGNIILVKVLLTDAAQGSRLKRSYRGFNCITIAINLFNSLLDSF